MDDICYNETAIKFYILDFILHAYIFSQLSTLVQNRADTISDLDYA